VTLEELKPIIEAIVFVSSDEPLTFKQLVDIFEEESEGDVRTALDALVAEYANGARGFELRQVAGGYRFSTRPEHSEYIRRFRKLQPSARLSIAALETLAVIAYKQPVTIPEILEIRGVSSSSSIKTLLDKRLIVAKGRKKVVGRPMMYGTSKEFLVQFGINDLSELPNLEDFEDLMTS
jgi:segregation and condensation protein B